MCIRDSLCVILNIKIIRHRNNIFIQYLRLGSNTVYPEIDVYKRQGQSSFNENVLKNMEISLPVDSNDSIDYTYISTFIKAQEKLSIKKMCIRDSPLKCDFFIAEKFYY